MDVAANPPVWVGRLQKAVFAAVGVGLVLSVILYVTVSNRVVGVIVMSNSALQV